MQFPENSKFVKTGIMRQLWLIAAIILTYSDQLCTNKLVVNCYGCAYISEARPLVPAVAETHHKEPSECLKQSHLVVNILLHGTVSIVI